MAEQGTADRAASELRRIATLHGYAINDGEPDPMLDRIVAMASRVFDCPIAAINFVDADTQCIKASVGVDPDLKLTDRTHAFCGHTIAAPDVLIVPDAQADPRFSSNPYVVGPPYLRFYAGAPLLAPDGSALGAICVIDRVPRAPPDAAARATLMDLAKLVVSQLEARKRRVALDEAYRQASRINAITRLVNDAPSCDAALTEALRLICADYDAAMGVLWRYHAGRDSLCEVGRHLEDGLDLAEPIGVLNSKNSFSARAIAANEPRIDTSPAHPRLLAAIGAYAMVVEPIWVGDERFGVSLAFRTPHPDLEGVARHLSLLTDSLRPMLLRKITEDHLKLLRAALDAASDVVIITEAEPLDDPGPRMLWANAAFTRETGYDLNEVIGKSPRRLMQGPETDPVASRALGAQLRRWEHSRAELLNYRKDGSPFWAELDITPIADETGWFTHWISIQRDVTERRAEQEARRTRDESFRLLFDDNPIPMRVVDSQTLRIIEVNHSACRLYGWPRADMLGMSVFDIKQSTDVPFMEDDSDRVWDGVKADGSAFRSRIAVRRLVYEGRDAMLVAVFDVTELEQTHASLRNTEVALRRLTVDLQERGEELTDALRLAHLATWRMAVDRATMNWSEDLYVLFGRTPATLASTLPNLLSIIHDEDRAAVERAIHAVFDQRAPQQIEFRVLVDTHLIRHCRVTARPVMDSGGAVQDVFGICQDITESRLAEEALRRSERLKALGQLTGGVAHDFNNLLTVTTLNLEEAIESLTPDDPMQELLLPALHAALRGAELTSRLLSYARRAPLRPERLSLRAFVADMAPLLKRLLGERHILVTRASSDDGEPLADPGQLESAIMNLVVNARDAMPDGGRIEIVASQRIVGSREPGVDGTMTLGHYAVIEVIDEGTGIAPELMGRVFEPFFTTKPPHSGSGLGLSMVYGFARQSGGEVGIVSTLGAGTTVSIYLPIRAEPRLTEPQPPTETNWRANGLRALAVEDQIPVLTAVTRMLRQLGFQVTAVDTATAALAELRAGASSYDLLFSDIVLPPPMSGLDLAAEARRIAPELRVLLTSGFAADRLDTPEPASFDDFIAKPYKREQLRAKLSHLFGSNRHAQEHHAVEE